MAETLAVVVGYVSNYKLHLRLVCMPMLKKPLTGEHLVYLLTSTLMTEMAVNLRDIVVATHDRASTNYKVHCTLQTSFDYVFYLCFLQAITSLKAVAPHVLSFGCLSHTYDHVGEHVDTPDLDTFFTHWLALFCNSISARDLFRTHFDESYKVPGDTRWWAEFETKKQIAFGWAYVQPMLADMIDKKVCPKVQPKVTLALDGLHGFQVSFQLATCVDGLDPFVKVMHSHTRRNCFCFLLYTRAHTHTGDVHHGGRRVQSALRGVGPTPDASPAHRSIPSRDTPQPDGSCATEVY